MALWAHLLQIHFSSPCSNTQALSAPGSNAEHLWHGLVRYLSRYLCVLPITRNLWAKYLANVPYTSHGRQKQGIKSTIPKKVCAFCSPSVDRSEGTPSFSKFPVLGLQWGSVEREDSTKDWVHGLNSFSSSFITFFSSSLFSFFLHFGTTWELL